MNRAEVEGVAQRIASRRSEQGMALADIAQHVGINDSWARDLETHDDDLPMTLSLSQVCRLAACLSVSPRELVCGKSFPNDSPSVDPQAIVEAIKAHLSANGITVEQFGDVVGWDVRSIIGDAARIWPDWNIDQTHDVCEALRIDWRLLLPASVGV